MPDAIANSQEAAAERIREDFPRPSVTASGRLATSAGRKRTFHELAASNNESYHFAVQEVIELLLASPRDEWAELYDELTFTVRVGQRAVDYDSGFAVDAQHLVALGQLGFWFNLVLNPEQP